MKSTGFTFVNLRRKYLRINCTEVDTAKTNFLWKSSFLKLLFIGQGILKNKAKKDKIYYKKPKHLL